MRGWLVVAVLLVWSTMARAEGLVLRSFEVHTSHAKVGSAFEVSSMFIDATYPAGTTSVSVVVRDRAGNSMTTTLTPDQNEVRPKDAALETGPAIAAFTLSDAHGATRTISVPVEVQHRRYACGMGAMAGLFFAAIVLAPAGLILLAIAGWVRSLLRRRKLAKEGTEVPPLVAEAMVQAVIHRILFVIALSTILSLALWFSGDSILAFCVAYVPFTRLFHLAGARRFLATLESGLPAKLHDNLLVTTDDITIPRGVIRDVQSRAVPVTTLATPR